MEKDVELELEELKLIVGMLVAGVVL